MKILVEHEVPCEKGMEGECLYPGDFWGKDVCKYHTHRDRTHGKKAPVERRVPKCTLFDEWLPGEDQPQKQPYHNTFDTEEQARLAWNTRAPILSAEEMEMKRLEALYDKDV